MDYFSNMDVMLCLCISDVVVREKTLFWVSISLCDKTSWKHRSHPTKALSEIWPVEGEDGSETRLDNYVWQADLWLRFPATPTAGWQVKLRKHSGPHLCVVFDLILCSTVKSVWPAAKSHQGLWDESSRVGVCGNICADMWGPEGSLVSAIHFFPSLTSQNATAHERTED